MKFVIYGSGYRGKRLQNYLGSASVVAYIDQDAKKWGNLYCDKVVISFETYKALYKDYFIIISPVYTSEIEEFLIGEGIYQFSNMLELPSEYSGYGLGGFQECYYEILNNMDDSCYIYGINAFSLMLYEQLEQCGKSVYLVPNTSAHEQKIDYIKHKFRILSLEELKNKLGTVLLSVRVKQDINALFFHMKVIDIFESSSNLKQYYNHTINKFKLSYQNLERCFIIATGSSLRSEDIECLKRNNDFCISMNSIYKCESIWKPNVYVCTDSVFISENKDEILNYDVPAKFIGDSCEDFWEADYAGVYKIHVVGSHNYNVFPDFSQDIAQKVYGFYTVTYACLQIAVYLGFKKIYLLGVDCKYNMGSAENHFVKDQTNDNKNHNEEGMIMAYKAAKKYSEEHGIEVFNATRGGMLEVFDRVDFDTLFGG